MYTGLTEKLSEERISRSYSGGAALGLSNAVMFLCYALLFWCVSPTFSFVDDKFMTEFVESSLLL